MKLCMRMTTQQNQMYTHLLASSGRCSTRESCHSPRCQMMQCSQHSRSTSFSGNPIRQPLSHCSPCLSAAGLTVHVTVPLSHNSLSPLVRFLLTVQYETACKDSCTFLILVFILVALLKWGLSIPCHGYSFPGR